MELLAENPATRIRLSGINLAGLEDWDSLIVEGRTLPWLQDTPDQNVWESWIATWRDVMILDPQNVHVQTYNLTLHDLADPAYYAELKALLKGVADEP